VVTVHGVDEQDGRVGLWMDRVHGRTLEELLALLGPCSAREAAAIGIDLCAALAAVHAVGLVHGDLKSQNVMREGTPGHAGGAGRIVLMDFGSAHSNVGGSASSPGTPLYTAPEVLRGGKTSPASDLYALGVLLYRLVSGRYPIDARTIEELEAKLERGELTSLRAVRPDLPNAFVAVVERALAPDPAHRFHDAAEMERALASAAGVWAERRAGLPWRKIRRALVPAAAALALAAIVAAIATAPRWRPLVFPKKASPDRLSQRLVADWVGGTADGLTGFMVAGIGDWDGDGLPDVAVGTPGAEPLGVVHIYRGGTEWGGAPDWTLTGTSFDDGFGRSIAGVGDLDGDGHADLAVGAVDDDRGGADAGSVSIYRGGPGADTKPDFVLLGPHVGQNFGDRLGRTGDVNGDGAPDLLVSAPYDDQAGKRSGRAYLYLGGRGFDDRPDAEFALGVESAQFGESKGIGDWNGDGIDDFAISARNAPGPSPRAGKVLVYFGGKTIDTHPDLVLQGEGENQFFGALAPCGDLNGDGHPDLVVGAMMAEGKEPEAGALYVYFGGPKGDAKPDLVLRGDSHLEFFGYIADGSTDFDRDGAADLVVAANGKDAATDSAGAVFFYRGGADIDDAPELVLRGRGVRTGFGASMAAIGDTRGDGIPDLVVGCPGDARGGSRAGAAKVFDFARFHVVRPIPERDAWPAGGQGTLEWLGSTRADVAMSADDGRHWKTIRARAGGGETNVLKVDVPASARNKVWLRIEPSDPALETGTVTFDVRVAHRTD
jgi:hypothetical protein